MESIIDLLNAISNSIQKGVLATIVHVEGRSYLKEGASMLIFEDGTCFGMLSPGCLEEDILNRLEEIIQKQIPQILTYDMSHEDDFGWGRGAGCNGILHILFEPITEQLKADLLWLREQLVMGKSVLHIKQFSRNFFLEKYEFHELEKYDPYHIPKKSGLQTNNVEQNYSYFHVYQPNLRLIIFGAGADSKALVSLAASNRFNVIVCDWRPGLCTNQNFPEASQLMIGTSEEIINKLKFTQKDYVVIMSHDYSKDKEFLEFILQKDVSYIGVLGPRDRTERLLNNRHFPPHLFSPIGLSIGASGPGEIAISIMAEIIRLSHF